MKEEERMEGKMKGVTLPGGDRVEFREYDIPKPGYWQVLVRMKCSTICGSDIRCIYHEHVGEGPEGYQGVIAGHEPCGQIVEEGPGLKRFKKGDRVIIYHISGCGVCHECRQGYMISCTSPKRAAYGWQRDGGMAEYILADEKDLVALPDELSYADGAQVACGFGTVYEGIEKVGVSGNDAVLVVGLGPVGLACLMLCKAMGADKLIGIDTNEGRLKIAKDLGLADYVFLSDSHAVENVLSVTGGEGCERTFDCSASNPGRVTAIKAARRWGRICFIGEGHDVAFEPSPDLLHPQKTIYGSWVTIIWKMEDLVERLVRWNLHPDVLITHRFPLDKADEAYALMASGKCGKVAVCQDEELK